MRAVGVTPRWMFGQYSRINRRSVMLPRAITFTDHMPRILYESTYPLVTDHSLLDTWALLNSIFIGDNPISRSQYYDTVKSNRLHIPEVRIWIDVLYTTVIDWQEYVKNPITETYRLVKDVEEWVNKETLSLSLIADAVFLAFQIDPEVFKRRFRTWIRKTKPNKQVASAYKLTEPFESMTVHNELVACPSDHKRSLKAV